MDVRLHISQQQRGNTKAEDISLNDPKTSRPRIIRWKIDLLESVTFKLQDRMSNSFSAQSLKSYGHFSDIEVEIPLSHHHVEKRWFFRVKWMRQSTE